VVLVAVPPLARICDDFQLASKGSLLEGLVEHVPSFFCIDVDHAGQQNKTWEVLHDFNSHFSNLSSNLVLSAPLLSSAVSRGMIDRRHKGTLAALSLFPTPSIASFCTTNPGLATVAGVVKDE